MTRRTTWWWAALALSAMVPACDGGGSGSGGGGGEKVCDPGTEVFCRPCEGLPDVGGTKTCNSEGTGFDACVPSGGACPIIDCTPGDTRFCKCGGEQGEQICNDEGTGYTACECGGAITCTPNQALFCTCEGGGTGQKVCNEDGTAYSACDCSGSGGSGGSGGGGSGGGGSGSEPLLAPCFAGSECESGFCPMGYCSKECAKISDCPFGAAECVSFQGDAFCMPTCETQSACDVYGFPSECGYTAAIDDFPVTTCADWTSDLELPPDGHACTGDEDCNLGHLGRERVCAFEACTQGCYAQADCPTGKECSSTGNLGNCE